MFASLLVRRGASPVLANAYAKAFATADNGEKRQRIVENLNLSHPMIGMALYGDQVYGKDRNG